MHKKISRLSVIGVMLAAVLCVTPQSAVAQTSSTVTTDVFATAPLSVEERVRGFFADTPVMIAIAECESRFRQFTDAGTVLRGGLGNGMVGVFQVYERIHAGAAATLGYNLSTLEGNLGYARHLYESQGSTPWNSSRRCWEPALADAPVAAADARATLLARIVELQQLISTLQRRLAEKQLVTRR